MAATLDRKVHATAAVFEAKFMAPRNISEERAAETHMALRFFSSSVNLRTACSSAYSLDSTSCATKVAQHGVRMHMWELAKNR